MYIKSVHIDGFKSYGKKVEVNGFDRQFNAVTGLNGTGKSNILDSICFVLGISNLSHLRVNSLQELIFKNGQAGVSSATVVIIFDNADEENSPPGYEQFKTITVSRQVVMGGKNKYWINGCVVPIRKVQDFFCSIQLNINNPHFLIMQGRVTKVLNMKAHEIVAMLEEASGTRMYETKKVHVEKILEKKNVKLVELNAIIKDEISPRLEKLKQERHSYMEYMRIERELENMKSLFDAYLFHVSERLAAQAVKKMEQVEAELHGFHENIHTNEAQIADITKEIEDLLKKAKENTNGELERLENEVKCKEMANVKAAAVINANADTIETEKKKYQDIEENIKDEDKVLQGKRNEMVNVDNLFETLKENDRRDTDAYKTAQKKYEYICSGMEINDAGKAQTLQEQLIVAREEVSTHSTAIKVSSNKLAVCERELMTKEALMRRSTGSDYNAAKGNVDGLKKMIARMEAECGKLNYNEENVRTMKQAVERINAEMRRCRSSMEDIEARRPYAFFSYQDPVPNFDRRQVCGMVCRLITVRDAMYGTAVETAAGSKLFNIICINETVSKQILERGRLQQRVTFLPLTKIQGGRISAKVIEAAKSLVGAENVVHAMQVIEFDARLKAAIEYVFGHVLVCTNVAIANRVAFHPQIRCRCVTLDGDISDPGGTLSGGAPSRNAPILPQMKTVMETEARLSTLDNELRRLQNELGAQLQVEEKFKTLQQRLDVKNIELRNVEGLMEQTPYHQTVQEVEACRKKVSELKEQIANSKTVELSAQKRIRTLEENLRDADGYRERTRKEATAEMQRAQQQAEKSHNEWQQRVAEYEGLKFEIVALEKTIEGSRAQLVSMRAEIEKLQVEHTRLTAEHDEHTKELRQLQARHHTEMSAITAKNREVTMKNEQKEALQAQIENLRLDIQKQEHVVKKQRDEVKKANGKREESAKRVQTIERNVVQEAATMNESGGENLRKKIARDDEMRQRLGRNINVNAQKMFEQEEKHHTSLMSRQRIIESDRRRLLDVIKKLDAKKQDALKLAYNQVKKDFGSIFATLLPGAGATLVPPANKTILQGLEIKVSLGGIWKDNLTELSGGQRSLAALSLILAMLLFKPAPLYILDEVDAALDLSHTQNIGAMLKDHFKQSQFIVVSLKDGMFSNANVLFRTKFVDGVSAVTRTVNKRS